jgi:hypothetical protein
MTRREPVEAHYSYVDALLWGSWSNWGYFAKSATDGPSARFLIDQKLKPVWTKLRSDTSAGSRSRIAKIGKIS